ncbi:MAG: DUF1134 domain-containing protein [Pseudomonadota bacterium]
MKIQNWTRSRLRAAFVLIASLGILAAPVAAQDVESFDPDEAFGAVSAEANDTGGIDADLTSSAQEAESAYEGQSVADWGEPVRVPADQTGAVEVVTETQPGFDEEFADYSDYSSVSGDEIAATADHSGEAVNPTSGDVANATDSTTYGQDDLIGAAEGVFGKGAKGLAGLIEDLLREQGEPNGYIVGREAGGAFILGARYGSGTLHHKIEGTRKVYWTGPSIGFDVGANAANSFVLVYNLYDSEELFARYPAGEGQAYLVGGLHVSYLRKGDKVLIPIRVGAGLRLGVNAGYMKFSKKQRWLPF